MHCVVTSPPYYGLRDYGVDGQIGLEDTPAEFLQRLVELFREVRRVLRKDGTCWVNMGDTYAGSWGAEGRTTSRAKKTTKNPGGFGLKKKDLMGMPWRLALALQSDGWYLRSDIVWSKPNPMPSSVKDRPALSHEYVFLLTKSARYFYDADAVKERAVGEESITKPAGWDGREGGHRELTGRYPGNGVGFGHGYDADQRERGRIRGSKRNSFARETKASAGEHGQKPQHRPGREDVDYTGTRNRRTVWTIPVAPFKGAHFATFPPLLVQPCILAGCPLGGVVLDMFGGAGTVALVADRLGRDSINIELNPEYITLAQARLATDVEKRTAAEARMLKRQARQRLQDAQMRLILPAPPGERP